MVLYSLALGYINMKQKQRIVQEIDNIWREKLRYAKQHWIDYHKRIKHKKKKKRLKYNEYKILNEVNKLDKEYKNMFK